MLICKESIHSSLYVQYVISLMPDNPPLSKCTWMELHSQQSGKSWALSGFQRRILGIQEQHCHGPGIPPTIDSE